MDDAKNKFKIFTSLPKQNNIVNSYWVKLEMKWEILRSILRSILKISKTNKNELLIKLCQQIIEIIENEYPDYNSFFSNYWKIIAKIIKGRNL